MACSLTFIHAADLHIGAPFRGLRAASEAWGERLMSAIAAAYERVIDAALANEVDFVVFAGDSFDNASASYADYRRFFKGLCRLGEAGIAAYLCTGNHDPYASWQQDFFALPENARMFAADKPDFALHERAGEPLCVLGGRGYLNSVVPAGCNLAEGITRQAALAALPERASQAPFGVGVLHTGLNLDPTKAPVSPSELRAAGFDYWALGHIHQPYVDDAQLPPLVFSGCIQGRDINETGARGVNLVTLEQGRAPRIQFVPTASVVWEKVAVDVRECASVVEVGDTIAHTLFAACGNARCEQMVARVTLEGQTPLHDVLSRADVIEDVRCAANEVCGDFFVDAIIDKTTRVLDRDTLAQEGLFPAFVMRSARQLREDDAARIAYLQQEFLDRGIAVPACPLRDAEALVDEAENQVLDMLMREG